ncbi:hypothetical protein SHO565_72280 [Streptomyces sp. HO565]
MAVSRTWREATRIPEPRGRAATAHAHRGVSGEPDHGVGRDGRWSIASRVPQRGQGVPGHGPARYPRPHTAAGPGGTLDRFGKVADAIKAEIREEYCTAAAPVSRADCRRRPDWRPCVAER